MAPCACCSSFAAVALLALGHVPRHVLAEAPAPVAPGRPGGSPYLVPLRRESVPIRRKGKVVSFKTSYSGNISVGRPAQEFRVVFDTGSGHLVLPAAECLSPSCLAHRRYNVSRSETAVPINGDGSVVAPGDLCDQVTIGFGTGEVTGEFVRERVCLGSEAWPAEGASMNGLVPAPCVDMHVVTAVEMSTQPFRSFAFDGILGLALSGLALTERFSYLEVVAGQQGGPLLDPRPAQFAAFLTEGDDGEASEIAFGGHNPTRALEPLSWAPVALPGLGYWQVQILSVRIGGVALDVCQDGTCRGVIDTGSSHLGVPATHEAQVAAMLTRPASAGEDCRLAGAPAVEIEIPGRNLTLGPENYMRRMPLEENVSVGVRGVSLNGSSPRRPPGGGGAPVVLPPAPAGWAPRLRASKEDPADAGAAARSTAPLQCRPKLMAVSLPEPLGPNLFILGEPVLHRYYTVFDSEHQQIGFGLAANRQNAAAAAAPAAKAARAGASLGDESGARRARDPPAASTTTAPIMV